MEKEEIKVLKAKTVTFFKGEAKISFSLGEKCLKNAIASKICVMKL